MKADSKTVRKHCPHCGHNKAHEHKPKKCSRCGKINQGIELKKEKHNRQRSRAVNK